MSQIAVNMYAISGGTPLIGLIECDTASTPSQTLGSSITWGASTGTLYDKGTQKAWIAILTGSAPVEGDLIDGTNRINFVHSLPQFTSRVSVGDLVTFEGETGTYYVQTVDTDFTLTLTVANPIVASARMMFINTSTTSLGIPLPEPGDQGAVGIIKAGFQEIDSLLDAARRRYISFAINEVPDEDPVLFPVALNLPPHRLVRSSFKTQTGTCEARWHRGTSGATNFGNPFYLGSALKTFEHDNEFNSGTGLFLELSGQSANIARAVVTLEINEDV